MRTKLALLTDQRARRGGAAGSGDDVRVSCMVLPISAATWEVALGFPKEPTNREHDSRNEKKYEAAKAVKERAA